jgi:hypothetical protein
MRKHHSLSSAGAVFWPENWLKMTSTLLKKGEEYEAAQKI